MNPVIFLWPSVLKMSVAMEKAFMRSLLVMFNSIATARFLIPKLENLCACETNVGGVDFTAAREKLGLKLVSEPRVWCSSRNELLTYRRPALHKCSSLWNTLAACGRRMINCIVIGVEVPVAASSFSSSSTRSYLLRMKSSSSTCCLSRSLCREGGMRSLFWICFLTLNTVSSRVTSSVRVLPVAVWTSTWSFSRNLLHSPHVQAPVLPNTCRVTTSAARMPLEASVLASSSSLFRNLSFCWCNSIPDFFTILLFNSNTVSVLPTPLK